jgi:hypothetical protein
LKICVRTFRNTGHRNNSLLQSIKINLYGYGVLVDHEVVQAQPLGLHHRRQERPPAHALARDVSFLCRRRDPHHSREARTRIRLLQHREIESESFVVVI